MEDKVSAITLIIVRPDKTILMQKRDDGQGRRILYPNKWCFPGGKKEKGEDYINCAIREAKEEYNLVLKEENCRLIHMYNHDGTENDHVFLCTVDFHQEPKLLEGAGMDWMRIDQIKKLSSELAWVQQEIISKVEENLRSTV